MNKLGGVVAGTITSLTVALYVWVIAHQHNGVASTGAEVSAVLAVAAALAFIGAFRPGRAGRTSLRVSGTILGVMGILGITSIGIFLLFAAAFAFIVPQRINFITLGAQSVPTLRAFYRAWGWTENDGSSDTYASFNLGAVKLALYPADLLRDEAAPGAPPLAPGAWNNVTLAINFATRAAVDDAIAAVLGAGGSAIAPATQREWGGYSGYVADPEGTRWELACAPDFDPGD